MKSVSAILLCSIALIFSSLSFNKQLPIEIAKQKVNATLVACAPNDEIEKELSATHFTTDPKDVVLIRKEITTLSPVELKQFRDAIDMMKSKTITFEYEEETIKKGKKYMKKGTKTMSIWNFQAALHGEVSDQKKINVDFRKCSHRKRSFLSWHRMYLYYFERIMHSYMPAGSNLGLPYWDSQSSGKIPEFARVKTLSNGKINPLYNSTRNSSIANGGYFPEFDHIENSFENSEIYKEIENAMSLTEFYSFQQELEKPHSSIHEAVGGNLYSLASPKDPLFWMHHANIDRLWEKWLAKKGGRCNPTEEADSKWWNRTFYFYDENKARVSMTASQINNIVDDLHYKYQGLTSIGAQPKKCNNLDLSVYASLGQPQKKYSISNAEINSTDDNEFDFAQAHRGENFHGSLAFVPSAQQRGNWPNFFKSNYFLEFENIKVNKAPEGIVKLYLADKRDTSFTPRDKNYIGTLDLFTALSVAGVGQNHEHEEDEPADPVFRISLNNALKKVFFVSGNNILNSLGLNKPNSKGLKDAFENIKNIRIHFVVVGNVLNGKEVKKDVDIVIGKLSLAAYKKN
jgi:hypothetical protein